MRIPFCAISMREKKSFSSLKKKRFFFSRFVGRASGVDERNFESRAAMNVEHESDSYRFPFESSALRKKNVSSSRFVRVIVVVIGRCSRTYTRHGAVCNVMAARAISLGHLGVLGSELNRKRMWCDSSCLEKCLPSPKLLILPVRRWKRFPHEVRVHRNDAIQMAHTLDYNLQSQSTQCT